MSEPEILRYAAFTEDPAGGNPAGVVLDASALDDDAMQRIAAEVDYAETAFVSGSEGGARRIRYFSPIAEVPFCGHATIATAVALAEREGAGTFRFATQVGEVVIETDASDEHVRATFTSVEPTVDAFDDVILDEVLSLLQLTRGDLDDRYPPRIAFAGNPHPVLVLADATVFDTFTFSPVAVRSIMDVQGWPATISVLHALGDATWEARNLFPVGRITGDPATGSAAAAFGGYLRELGLVEPPAEVVIHQGRHAGRPSVLAVAIPPHGGIRVAGTAVPIPGE
ncbi:PhzF family phenazine biosynthesis protein [Agromyces aerolatus]|uniref:PhzF family phenazine biosynthesis protein n=1 Tax=Agromyces sp. LY-1074 TaxID=3074080 RepID=UPI002861E6CE|nr:MULTISPECIES: PhzF family phenazine biosynthesis protein [unclassified Agromyces]MDR5698520.1 PhzF family phenazine biosynthesis protein [Agromyces sp. LY-1074]MDR5704814.1 PhzF family phenazine biosynthesis protein [Agromyces sp. LY-1358]